MIIRFAYCLLLTTFLLGTSIAYASDDIVIVVAEARVNDSHQGQNTYAYMHIINYSEEHSVELINVSSELTPHVEFANNQPLIIKAGEAADFEPGGYHIQLSNINQNLQVGDNITLTLDFAHGDSYEIDTAVVKAGTHLHEDDSGESVAHADHQE